MDARDAIERRTLSQELRDASQSLQLVRALCESAKWDLAAHVLDNTLLTLSFAKSRWASVFDSDGHKALTSVISQSDIIRRQVLRYSSTVPTTDERHNLNHALIRTLQQLTAECGRQESRIDPVTKLPNPPHKEQSLDS